MKQYSLWLGLIICFLQSVCGATTPLTAFNTLLSRLHTMQATVQQTTIDASGKPQVSDGTLALIRPGYFRFEITKPIPQLIIVNRKQVVLYDPDLAQATIYTLSAMQHKGSVIFLSDSAMALNKNYIVSSGHSSEWFILTPRQRKDNALASIAVQFIKGVFTEIRLTDSLGHLTIIRLHNIQINKPLPSALFVFKKPAGVDVIKNVL